MTYVNARARRPSGSSLFVLVSSFQGLHSSIFTPPSSIFIPPSSILRPPSTADAWPNPAKPGISVAAPYHKATSSSFSRRWSLPCSCIRGRFRFGAFCILIFAFCTLTCASYARCTPSSGPDVNPPSSDLGLSSSSSVLLPPSSVFRPLPGFLPPHSSVLSPLWSLLSPHSSILSPLWVFLRPQSFSRPAPRRNRIASPVRNPARNACGDSEVP